MEPYATFNKMTANCQSKIIQTKNGPLTIMWSKDKTFEQIAAEFITEVYRFNKAALGRAEAQTNDSPVPLGESRIKGETSCSTQL